MAEPARNELVKDLGKESLAVDENRRKAYLARKAKPTPDTQKRYHRPYNWIDRLYVTNKIALMKFLPLVILYPFGRLLCYLVSAAGMPGIGKLLPWHAWVNPRFTTFTWLPVAEEVKVPEHTPVPLAVLDLAIETAAHRFVLDECFCRRAFNCKEHPATIGCLVMGDQPFTFIDDMGGIGREVSIEDAKKHVRRAVADGLVPGFGKARADCWLFGYRDRARMAACCFCCDCCCVFANYEKAWTLDVVNGSNPRLEGATMRLDEALCNDCGKCVEKCVRGGLKLKKGKPFVTEKCRACGQCTLVCPTNAIEVKMTDPYWLDKTFDRVLEYVEWREGHSPMKLK